MDKLSNYRAKEVKTPFGIDFYLQVAVRKSGAKVAWIRIQGLQGFETLAGAKQCAERQVEINNQKIKYHYFKDD